MSIEVMNLAWYVNGLTPAQKAVLVALADHASDDGTNARPSVERLLLKTSYSERTVRRALGDLREMRLIHVTREANYHYPTCYRLDLPEMQARQERPARDAPHDLPESPEDLPEMHERPARDAPKPSKNHQEPSAAAREAERIFGGLSRYIVDEINDAIKEFGEPTVLDALEEAAPNQPRSWKYIDRILKRWAQEGRGPRSNGSGAETFDTIKAYAQGHKGWHELQEDAQMLARAMVPGGNPAHIRSMTDDTLRIRYHQARKVAP